MAGLFVALGAEPGWAERQLAAHLPRMLHSPWLRARTFSDGLLGAAVVLHERVEPPLWRRSRDDRFLGLFGEYHHEEWGTPPPHALADELAELCRQERWDALRNRNGIYNLLAWDAREERLALANDATGALLLFCAERPDGWLWSSEPGALASDGAVDATALRSLVALGYQADARTLRVGVSVMPAATTDVVTVERGRLVRRRRSGLPSAPEPAKGSFARGFSDLFRAAVELRLGRGDAVDVPLSGGEDSRILAAAAVDRGCDVRSFTLEALHPPDAVIGAMVARRLGLAHRVESSPDRPPEALLRAAISTCADWHCGLYLPVFSAARPGAALALGFLGGTFAGAAVDRASAMAGLARLRDNALAPYRRAGALPVEDLPWCEVPPGWAAAPEELMVNLYGRQRRYTSYLVRLAWNFGRPICPFADARLMALALSARRVELAGQSARRAAICGMYPALASIPSANDGLPLDARLRRSGRLALRRAGLGRIVRRFFPSLRRGFDFGRLEPMARAWARDPAASRRLQLPDDLPPMALFAALPLLLLETDEVIATLAAMVGAERGPR